MSVDILGTSCDNAEARFSNSLRPRKPEGSLGRTAQDVHLDSHTAPELCDSKGVTVAFYSAYTEVVYWQCCLVVTWLMPRKTGAVSSNVIEFHLTALKVGVANGNAANTSCPPSVPFVWYNLYGFFYIIFSLLCHVCSLLCVKLVWRHLCSLFYIVLSHPL